MLAGLLPGKEGASRRKEGETATATFFPPTLLHQPRDERAETCSPPSTALPAGALPPCNCSFRSPFCDRPPSRSVLQGSQRLASCVAATLDHCTDSLALLPPILQPCPLASSSFRLLLINFPPDSLSNPQRRRCRSPSVRLSNLPHTSTVPPCRSFNSRYPSRRPPHSKMRTSFTLVLAALVASAMAAPDHGNMSNHLRQKRAWCVEFPSPLSPTGTDPFSLSFAGDNAALSLPPPPLPSPPPPLRALPFSPPFLTRPPRSLRSRTPKPPTLLLRSRRRV